MQSVSRAARKPTIGFLAARLDEPYQYAVWSGAAEEAAKLGATVVFFGGQRVRSPIGYEALDNIAFDLASRSRVSALVVMANVIGTYLNHEELTAFLGRFGSVPVVSVGVDFPGIPSVSVPNAGGMSAIAEHLAVVHGRRNFLFLAGPPGHPESSMREEEFRTRLNELLGGEGSIVTEACNFQEEDAHATMERVLGQGRCIDAVVAANDLMAMGALRALAEAKVEVPREVSVTGFDDTDDSRFSVPPLTTVCQPTRELGREATRHVARELGLLRDGIGRAKAAVSFVIRESCGCPPSALSASLDEEPQIAPETRTDPAAQTADAEPGKEDPLACLARAVNDELRVGRSPAGLRPSGLDPSLRDRALLVVAEGESRYQAGLRRSAEKRAAVLRDIESSLISSFSIPDILFEVARGTRTLGISACWLALFESQNPRPDWARLFLASEGEKLRILAPYGMRFRTAELIPGGLPKRWPAYVCEPLRFGEERLGYLVCTADGDDRLGFEALRDQASSAIKGALLMAAERGRERNLEHEVRVRTLELSAANDRLRDEIERRTALERELLDISNDIMGRIGRDIHDDLCQEIAGIGLMAAILEGSLRRIDSSETGAAAESAAAIARAAAATASQAKGMARGLYPAELEAKGLPEAVAELVRAARERSAARIVLDVTGGFSIKNSEKALQLYRIIQEALGNAVSHAKATEIIVGLRMDRETVQVEVEDDGVGIGENKRNGLGMGLRIMKYRASVIDGELRVRSKGVGTSVSCRVAR